MSDLPLPLIALSDAIAQTVARHAPSVVAVHTKRSRASGFVWRSGLVVTADEALPDDETDRGRVRRRVGGRRDTRGA